MEKVGPQTRGQGLCKHEDTVHTRHLNLVQGLKVASDPGESGHRAEIHVHARPPPPGTPSFRSLTGHFVMAAQEYFSASVALEQLDATLQ